MLRKNKTFLIEIMYCTAVWLFGGGTGISEILQFISQGPRRGKLFKYSPILEEGHLGFHSHRGKKDPYK